MPPRIAGPTQTTFLAAWRDHAGLTQDEVIRALAERGTAISKPSLSRLENGHQPYSEPILGALAELYGCRPADLISRHPNVGPSLDALVSHLSLTERDRVVEVVKAMLR